MEEMQQLMQRVSEMQNSPNSLIRNLGKEGQAKAIALRERWQDPRVFLQAYSPSRMQQLCTDRVRCFDLDCKAPTLTIVAATYGDSVAQSFLALLVRDSLTCCEGKDVMSIQQIDSLVKTWLLDPWARQLKLSEWFYFFHLFKNGQLGIVYGSITPKVFADALQSFKPIRARFIEEVESAKAEERRKQSGQGAISFAQWKAQNENKVSPQTESIINAIMSQAE